MHLNFLMSFNKIKPIYFLDLYFTVFINLEELYHKKIVFQLDYHISIS